MRRVLRRRWWALSLSAGLALALPASAQPPTGPAAHGPRATPPPGSVAPVQRQPGGEAGSSEDANRLTEIAIELAWLADPVTFPQLLAARVNGGTLEIRGTVPSATVRERVARVARQHCSLSLLDHLKVQPRTPPSAANLSLQEVQRAVCAALKTSFPRLAGGITLKCQPHGQVTLSGVIPTHEEKLAVSQALRGVSGCMAVLNQLQVSTAVPASTLMPATASVPPAPVPAAPAPAPTAQPPARPAGPASPYGQVGMPAAQGAPRSVVQPASANSGPTSAGSTNAATFASAASYQIGPAPVTRTESTRRGRSPLFAQGRTREQPVKALPAAPAPPGPPPSTVAVAPTREMPPGPVPASHVAPAPAAVREPVTTMAPKYPIPAEPYETTGIVYSGDPLPPPQPAAKAPAVQTVAAATPPRPEQPSSPPATALQAQLKAAIQKACGPAARDLEVVLQPPKRVLVGLRAGSKAEADRLAGVILTLPELAAYEPELQIKAPQ
ncbi:MAG: BON domain-containing protein [Gemmataceae bacterium]|nr:BON domain-containing protein [Gemmataceae bacterium]